jgi:predicted ABC-type ATPase
MPQIIIVAGPNGAGKTSFASEYLPRIRGSIVYVNADEIGREPELLGLEEGVRNIRAGRLMLEQLDALSSAGADFMFETTLATLTYARKIPIWRSQGYRVALFYLRLPDVDASMERVRRRVASGGHGIPETSIRRRFKRSLEYLGGCYKLIVDEWHLWDSLEGDFQLVEMWSAQ